MCQSEVLCIEGGWLMQLMSDRQHHSAAHELLPIAAEMGQDNGGSYLWCFKCRGSTLEACAGENCDPSLAGDKAP